MNVVFLDTVGMIALWDEADQWHEAATKAFAEILANRTRITTTSFVLLECGNAATGRPYRHDASQLRISLEASNRLIHPTVADWLAAWQYYEQSAYDNAGIVDLTSFAVMRRLGITKAFTNDKHFHAAGFTTLF